jgi:hypothetical protein
MGAYIKKERIAVIVISVLFPITLLYLGTPVFCSVYGCEPLAAEMHLYYYNEHIAKKPLLIILAM